MIMKKKCTQSSCRRIFNPAKSVRINGDGSFTVCCPYCGKAYPRFAEAFPISDQVQVFEDEPAYSITEDGYAKPSFAQLAIQVQKKTGIRLRDAVNLIQDIQETLD